MIPTVSERRMMLTILLLASLLVTYWYADPQFRPVYLGGKAAGHELVFRAYPVRQVSNVATGASANGMVEIESTVIRDRNCRTLLQRYIFDTHGRRTVLEDVMFERVGPTGPDTIRQLIPLDNVLPGPGKVRLSLRWWCQPLDEVFPRTLAIDVPITVTP